MRSLISKKSLNLGKIYESLYDTLCGRHPNVFSWHFQWHATKDLHVWQKEKMQAMTGTLLDVGCGNKPYLSWLFQENVSRYIGLDIISHPDVDVVVDAYQRWPFADAEFDHVMMFQSMEHFADLNHVLAETWRVLKPNGTLLITVPFLYPAHGVPFDFRRYTSFGLQNLLDDHYEIQEITTKGKMGSVLAVLLLTGIENVLNYNFATRILKGLLLPLFIPFSWIINKLGQVVNALDVAGTHYCQVSLSGKKRER